MREKIEAVVDELHRMRAEGVGSVAVNESSLEALRGAVGRVGRAKSVPTSVGSPRGSKRQADGRLAVGPGDFSIAAIPPSPEVRLPGGDKRARWEWLREFVVKNPVCREHLRPGKNVVFGVGNLEADIFFCGEAPGAEEEIQCEPFVGRAGELLTRMIKAMGLEREKVYIGNIMNWRPELPTAAGNRPPVAEEMAYCLPFLRAQLDIVRPKVVCALGATAAAGLLGPDSFKRLGDIRGRWHEFNGIPLMITYHPSYLLRNQSNRSKRVVWEDLMQVMGKAGLPISEKQRNYFLG